MKKIRDKQMGMCSCGHPQQEHEDTLFEADHGECTKCNCHRFTWKGWLQEEIPAPINNINFRRLKNESKN